MSDKKPKLLVVSSRFPYPLEKGDKLRLFYQLKVLSKQYEIILCSLTDVKINEEWLIELSKYCNEIHYFKLNKAKRIINLFFNLFLNQPHQVAYFYQSRIKKHIHSIIDSKKPDAIYCQLIRSAEYVKDIYHIPKTLDYMDALSEGMLKRSKISKFPFNLFYKNEGKRLKKYENYIFDFFDHHTIISEQDKKLITHPNYNSIKIVPNGISDEFLNYNCSVLNKKYDLVFVGNLSYQPNIESCLYLVQQIIPILNRQNIKLKLLISGANPSSKLLKLANDQVTIKGWVDDIKTSYCQGSIFVAPLFIGTGLQNKLLEAMALKLPCITTSLVNNALKAKKNEQLLIANTKDEFVNAIKSIYYNNNLRNSISAEGYKFVKENYNWESATLKIPIL
jgi:sugar transferase (PEP-CTERM/EpsH1 system associated)